MKETNFTSKRTLKVLLASINKLLTNSLQKLHFTQTKQHVILKWNNSTNVSKNAILQLTPPNKEVMIMLNYLKLFQEKQMLFYNLID
jgi:hypothetical protein